MKLQINRDRLITIIICTAIIITGILYKSAPMIYYKKGRALLDKQDYARARYNFQKSYFFDNKNKDNRYYYVQALIHLPPDISVQKELFEIANGNLDDSAQQAAMQQINEWKNQIAYKIGDNYIEQTPFESGTVRWDKDTFPLKININNESGKNVPEYYESEIKRAFAQWQQSTGFLSFVYTDNPRHSNISVKIANIPSDICNENNCKYIVAYTKPEISGNLLKKMTITLYATDPKGSFFSDKELYNTILHEIGHAMGIMGHSYSSGDLMYMYSEDNNSFYVPYRSSFQYLSSQDINTMELLYKFLPDISNTSPEKLNRKNLIYPPIILGTGKEINSRKLKEAKNYIKNAPDIPAGYIDLGIAYSELGNKKEAIKAIQKAYNLSRTQNEKYISAYNLAVVYLENNNPEKAMQYAKEAQNISNSDIIKELIMNIKHSKYSKKK